jgi:alkaline phosphatase
MRSISISEELNGATINLQLDEPNQRNVDVSTINNILFVTNSNTVQFKTGGRIDHGHHDTQAHLALDETVEFAKAIQAAVDLTDERNTLIVVTADHAHTLSISGYPTRGNDIFGKHD